jgi:predicted DNA binding CopG/RHH family protein
MLTVKIAKRKRDEKPPRLVQIRVPESLIEEVLSEAPDESFSIQQVILALLETTARGRIRLEFES